MKKSIGMLSILMGIMLSFPALADNMPPAATNPPTAPMGAGGMYNPNMQPNQKMGGEEKKHRWEEMKARREQHREEMKKWREQHRGEMKQKWEHKHPSGGAMQHGGAPGVQGGPAMPAAPQGVAPTPPAAPAAQ